MLRKMLNTKHLTKPYKLFFLGAEKNNKLGAYALLLLCCCAMLLLLLLLPLLLPIFLVDFSQKIWYNQGIEGGSKARHKMPSFFLGNIS